MNKKGILNNKKVVIGQQNTITANTIVFTNDFYSKLISGEMFNIINNMNATTIKKSKEKIADILKEEQKTATKTPEVFTLEDLGINTK